MTDKDKLTQRMRKILANQLQKHDTHSSWWDIAGLEKTQGILMSIIYDAMISARNEALEEAVKELQDNRQGYEWMRSDANAHNDKKLSRDAEQSILAINGIIPLIRAIKME